MDRVVRGRSATLYHTFYVNGVATDPAPDAATITIVRDNGDIIVSDDLTTNEATPGLVSYTLTPAQNDQLDLLTVTWDAEFGNQPQQFIDRVEVVGGVYFTIAEARQSSPLGDTTSYPVQRIVEARAAAEQAIEEECGIAFVPRYARATVNGDNTYGVRLPWPAVRAVRWATVDGATRDVSTVSGGGSGYLFDSAWWPYGHNNIQVGYEHGFDEPPEGIKRAALQYARQILVDATSQSIDPRAERLITDDGTLVFGGAGAGRFAALGVEQALAPYRMPVIG